MLAQQRTKKIRRNLYFAEINRASLTTLDSTALQTVREVTRKWIPGPGEADLRGWEWHYLDNLYRYDLFSFDGHRDEVGAVAYSPDGTRAASHDRSGTLWIWSAADGSELLEWEGTTHTWSPLRWNPEGDELAFFDHAKHLIRLDVESGEVKMKVQVPNANAGYLAWSPDGKRFAVRRNADALLVMNAGNGDIEHVIATDYSRFGGFAWGPESSELAAASGDGNLSIWDADADSSVPKRPPGASLRFLSWSPDGKYLAGETGPTAEAAPTPSRSIGVVDARTMKRVEMFPGHFNHIRSVVWSDDSQLVISSSSDYTVRVWKPGERREQHVIPCTEVPFGISWNSASRHLAVTEGNRVRVVDGTRQSVHRWWGRGDHYEVRWSPDGSRLFSTGYNGFVRIWDPDTKAKVAEFGDGTGGRIHSACWSPDGTRLASAAAEIVIWDLAAGTELRRLDGHGGEVFSVDWSPDGNRLASCGKDGTIRIWDADSGDEVNKFSPEGVRFNNVANLRWSPDPAGRFLAVSAQGPERRTLILASESLDPVRSLESRDGSPVHSLAWNPDGTQIAIGSMAGIRIFDRDSGELLQEMSGHVGPTLGVDWSPDGRRLASAGADRMIRLWDVETGHVALTIKAAENVIKLLDWSPDGGRIVSSDFGYLNVWDGRPREAD